MKKNKFSLVMIAASLALTGCGGGGGSAPVTSTPVPVVPTPPDPTALQTTVATPSYAAGSFELEAITSLNQARTAYGAGMVAENSLLNTAASNHVQYILTRFQAADYAAATHTEDPSKPGFTGATVGERVGFAKYGASSSGENIASTIAVDGVTSDPGTVAIESLLSGPYHRFASLDGWRDVGIGHTSIRLPGEGGTRHTVVIDSAVALSTQAQAPASGWIGLWPSDKASGVLYSFAGESPDPIPVNNGACAGYPVSVQVKAGMTLTTTAFTLTESGTGQLVSSQLSTHSTDKNPVLARANAAYIIPFKPLKLSTQYTAHFVGANNGVTLDKTWTFTTRADNVKMIFGCDPGI